MRKYSEIEERINSLTDPMGFERSILVDRLPLPLARKYVNLGRADLSHWKQLPREKEYVFAEMKTQFDFTFWLYKKQRMLSFYRQMCKYSSWVWLIGDDLGDLTEIKDRGYQSIMKLCNHYHFHQ